MKGELKLSVRRGSPVVNVGKYLCHFKRWKYFTEFMFDIVPDHTLSGSIQSVILKATCNIENKMTLAGFTINST